MEKVEVTGELQERVERGYVKWCEEVGVPADTLSGDGRKRFWVLLSWVREKPGARERLVKTGWRSWRRKWRKIVFGFLRNRNH